MNVWLGKHLALASQNREHAATTSFSVAPVRSPQLATYNIGVGFCSAPRLGLTILLLFFFLRLRAGFMSTQPQRKVD